MIPKADWLVDLLNLVISQKITLNTAKEIFNERCEELTQNAERINQMITEDEKRQFLKNEEKLWDMAAITAAPTLAGLTPAADLELIAVEAYDLADALMAERRKRLQKV